MPQKSSLEILKYFINYQACFRIKITLIIECFVNLILGEELLQLFYDAPTAELPLSMLSSCDNGEGFTVVDLAVQSGAAKSQCKLIVLFSTMTN